LAVFAAQGAATEENSTAAAAACQSGFFPLVEHSFGHQSGIRATTEAGFTGGSVHTTLPWTQIAVYITHKMNPLA
jgi:hypothetical protein